MSFTSLDILVDGDGAWPDLMSKHIWRDCKISIAGISRGTKGGKPAVMVRLDLADGSVAIASTTLALFLTAADTLRAYHGDPRT